MNRLIIVGNGFDLSHGLKSRFVDFLNGYTRNFIEKLINETDSQHYSKSLLVYEDELMKFNVRRDNPKLQGISEISNFEEFVKKYQESQDLIIKSPLLNILFEHINNEKNWIDFEMLYFETLVKVNEDSSGDSEKIRLYNKQFEFIKSEFIEYLKIEILENPLDFNTPSHKKFFDYYKRIFYDNYDKNRRDELLFLNFNYTNILREHINYHDNNPLRKINYIHGEIEDNQNPIIIGFGDEHDKIYKELESEKNHELFRYIKSVNYFKTRKYTELNRFMNRRIGVSEFEVLVIGHSCGLSDRTLLREIFEHKNCSSIKLFYYEDINGKSDYFEKSVEVMRHFENKNLVRKRVVYDENDKMIQLSYFENQNV